MGILRVVGRERGLAEYLRTGKRPDSKYQREDKDLVISIYGDLDIVEKAEEYVYKEKRWKESYLHITFSFTEEEFKKAFMTKEEEINKDKLEELVRDILTYFTSGYDLENEIIAYAELHYPKIKKENGKERLPHIHIELSKLNALLDNQIKTPKFNLYMSEVLQTYINKKYGLELPVEHWRKDKNKSVYKVAEKVSKLTLEELEDKLKSFYEARKKDIEKRRSKKAKELLNDIYKRKIENKEEATGRIKINKKNVKHTQISISIDRPTNRLEQELKEYTEEKKLDKELIKEIKEKINPEKVLEYVRDKYSVDMSKYKIEGNKIKKIGSKKKPKNVIDFLNKEVGLSIKESFNIAKEIYQNQNEKLLKDIKTEQLIDVENIKGTLKEVLRLKESDKELSENMDKDLNRNDKKIKIRKPKF